MRKITYIDMAGQRINFLTVLGLSDKTNSSQVKYWYCECDCGEIKEVKGTDLRSGVVKSCGRCSHYKHGLYVFAGRHRLTNIFTGMKGRCYNSKARSYPRYGGRGIYICEEWLQDSRKFYDWALANGYEDHLSIDRYPDNDGPYAPWNCRWATQKEQDNNKSTNKLLELNGEVMTLTQAVEFIGKVSYKCAKNRINQLGWSIIEAISTPEGCKHIPLEGLKVKLIDYNERHNLI